MINIDFLTENKELPYTKAELAEVKKTIEAIFVKHLTAWKTAALASRQSMSPAEYESANLLALETARQAISDELYTTFAKPILDKVFKQIYAKTGTYYRDGKKVKNKKK